jgi:hypothetical protein
MLKAQHFGRRFYFDLQEKVGIFLSMKLSFYKGSISLGSPFYLRTDAE